MVVIITGASHTGKTALAQRLLEKYKYPYLCIDHLKMGLIRSGNTNLTLNDDAELTDYLWPIVSNIIKTAIENKQNLIVEGCYVPQNWQDSFENEYLDNIKCYYLVMTENYITDHYSDIVSYASVIEQRKYDDITMENVINDNLNVLEQVKQNGSNCILIDDKYDVNIEL